LKGFLIVTGFIFLSVTGFSAEFDYRYYSAEQGLEQQYVYAICQDNSGYIWIGTGDGLYSFDGFEFRRYSREEGLGDNFISTLFCDKNGRVWIGHQNGTVSIRDGFAFHVMQSNTDNGGSVSTIQQDSKGRIWISIENAGMFISEKESLHLVPCKEDIDPSFSSWQEVADNMYLAGNSDELYLFRYNPEGRKISLIRRFEEYPGSRVVRILRENESNWLVISQDEGFFRYFSNGPDNGYHLSSLISNEEGLLDNLQDGILDKNGWLCMVSLGNGIARFKPDHQGNYLFDTDIRLDESLSSGNIKCIFKDAESNTWLGLYGEGLLMMKEKQLYMRQKTVSDMLESLLPVKCTSDELYFIRGDQLCRTRDDGVTVLDQIQLPVTTPPDRISACVITEEGSVWLGFEHTGIFFAESMSSSFQRIDISTDRLSNSINYILVDENAAWIATMKGVCRYDYRNGTSRWIKTVDGLPHNNVMHLFKDEDKVLISTSCNQIYYLTPSGEVMMLENTGLNSYSEVSSIVKDEIGAYWLATQGSGVWKVDNGEVLNYTVESGLFSDYCYSVNYSPNGYIILTHRGGISQIDPVTNRIHIFARDNDIEPGTIFFFNATCMNSENEVWMGTSSGLAKFQAGIPTGAQIPPQLNIKGIYVNGVLQDAGRHEITLKPGQYELKIDFVGISFSDPVGVIYQAFLEGYDNSWPEFTSERSMTYKKLSHGTYIFNLRAFNTFDIPNETADLFTLRIKKPFYLTVTFFVSVFLLLILIFVLIYLRREQISRNEQARLMKKIDEKTREVIVKEEIIKERKKVEDILIEARLKAETSDRLKTAFLQNMSHEIRTPMNAIQGFVNLLKEESIDPERKQEFIDIIDTNAKNLLSLIDDILDVSELEADQLSINEGTCKLEEMMAELTDFGKNMLKRQEKTGIQWEVEKNAPEGLIILSDPRRLKQILQKLIDNAVKFTVSGSIKIGYSTDKEHITFFVEDTGIGLSESTKEEIFGLFRKVAGDKMTLYGGTGIGLTLARYLVHLLGGEIYVSSKEGKGSRFYFILPLVQEYPPMGTELQDRDLPPEARWSNRTVLVVEDTDSNFLLLKHILEATGLRILRSVEGESAVHMLKENDPVDLVILDIKLPGIDGYETLERIRENYNKIPIIAYTAYTLEGDRGKALRAGFDAYIAKPSENSEIIKTIGDLLNTF